MLHPWLIFDADNTLWAIEELYDDARHALSVFISNRGHGSVASISKLQQEVDVKLFQSMGYSAKRFPTSFELTLKHYEPDADVDAICAVRRIADAVFERPGIPMPGVADIILSYKKQYKIGIITAGESWVQEKRIAAFEHLHLIDAILIVERKTTDVFDRFCKENFVLKSQSWMIGDSLASDIMPAVLVGLNAIHIQNKNWREVEHSVNSSVDYLTASSLLEIAGYIPKIPTHIGESI